MVVLFVVSASFAAPALAQSSAAHEQFLFAYKLLQRDETDLAADAFDDYLGNFPQDEKRGDGLYYRALLHRQAGENREAAERLKDVPATQIVPGYAVELLRGQVLTDLGEHEQALAALERIDGDDLEPAVRTSWRYLRGRAYRGAGNLPAAQEQFTAAAEADSPLRAKAMIDLARVQVLRDHEDEALETLRQAIDVARGDDAAEAARLAGDLSDRQGEHTQAAQYYDRVIAGHQDSSHFGPAVVGALWAHHAAGRYRMVIETFNELHDLLPAEQRVTARYLAGAAYHELGDHEAAARWLEQVAYGAGRHDHLEPALFRLAVSQQRLGKTDELRRAVDALREQFPESPRLVDAAYLLAVVEAEAGEVARGAARLTELIDQGPEHPYHRPAILRRARLLEAHDQPGPAADDFGRFVQASWEADDDSETVQQAALRWIDLLHRLNRHEQAEAAAAKLLEREGIAATTEQEALYRRALAQVRLGQAEPALASLDRLAERHPLHAFASPARYYRGLLLTSLGRADEATEALRAAADDDELARPLRANALRLVSLSEREQGEPEQARRTLKRLEQIVGRDRLNERERLWLGRDAVDHGEPQDALAYLAPLLPADDTGEAPAGSSPEVRAEAAYLAGRAHRRLGQADRAIHLLGYVVAMGRGHDQQARLERARALADAGRLDAAINEYAGVTRASDTDLTVQALYEVAMVHRRLAEQRRRRDDQAGVAEANDHARRNLKRITLLYAFKELDPLPQLAHLELAEIAREAGDTDAAAGELNELLEKYSDGPPARLARALLAHDEGRSDDARRLLEELRNTGDALDVRLADRIEHWRTRIGG
ncbi:MAG: tetratricopeptide repeat protein [Phycisphaeraceae bacterium]